MIFEWKREWRTGGRKQCLAPDILPPKDASWNLWTRLGGTGKSEPTWFSLNLALCSANFPCFCVSFMAPSLSFNIPWTLSSKPPASHGFADCPLCQVICLGPCWCVHVFYTLDWVSCWSDHPLWTEMILSGSHENSGESWNRSQLRRKPRIIKSESLNTGSSVSIFSLPRWF